MQEFILPATLKSK